jgi:Flp pilus assembly pilin Flp
MRYQCCSAQHGRVDLSLAIDGGRERGATAAEYALVVALIASVALGAVTRFGGELPRPYEAACRAFPGGNGNGNAGSPQGSGGGLATAPGQNRGPRC